MSKIWWCHHVCLHWPHCLIILLLIFDLFHYFLLYKKTEINVFLHWIIQVQSWFFKLSQVSRFNGPDFWPREGTLNRPYALMSSCRHLEDKTVTKQSKTHWFVRTAHRIGQWTTSFWLLGEGTLLKRRHVHKAYSIFITSGVYAIRPAQFRHFCCAIVLSCLKGNGASVRDGLDVCVGSVFQSLITPANM